ncbi:unnamed protein product [Linum trigynum]|uniref:Uncharacterized protein n=1 Tax=Linum trigynum TaxID=586398 RepID=A0AAV2DE86_9ROSI
MNIHNPISYVKVSDQGFLMRTNDMEIGMINNSKFKAVSRRMRGMFSIQAKEKSERAPYRNMILTRAFRIVLFGEGGVAANSLAPQPAIRHWELDQNKLPMAEAPSSSRSRTDFAASPTVPDGDVQVHANTAVTGPRCF